MDFKTRHIGSHGGCAASVVELTVTGFDGTITETVTDLKGRVNTDLIVSLQELADELQAHNDSISR